MQYEVQVLLCNTLSEFITDFFFNIEESLLLKCINHYNGIKVLQWEF